MEETTSILLCKQAQKLESFNKINIFQKQPSTILLLLLILNLDNFKKDRNEWFNYNLSGRVELPWINIQMALTSSLIYWNVLEMCLKWESKKNKRIKLRNQMFLKTPPKEKWKIFKKAQESVCYIFKITGNHQIASIITDCGTFCAHVITSYILGAKSVSHGKYFLLCVNRIYQAEDQTW